MKRVIYAHDAQHEIWSLLGLFESTKIVYDKLKVKYPSLSEDILIKRTDEITYSIRQAREFFSASDHASLLTRPLLLSYGMLNLGKALVFFGSSEDTNFENYFKSHGLRFIDSDDEQALANEYIEIKDTGTYPALSSIYNQLSYPNVRISLKNLLSQIPDLAEMFCIVYKEYPNVAPLKIDDYGHRIDGLRQYFDQFKSKVIETCDNLSDTKIRIGINENSMNVMRMSSFGQNEQSGDLDLFLPSLSGVEYFRAFPIIDSKPIILKEASIHYLLVFSYGMLSRYQSSRWGKYVDPNLSDEAEIINKSIQVCKIRYLHILVNYLFEEEFQFCNSIERPDINPDKLYKEFKRRFEDDIERDKRRGRW